MVLVFGGHGMGCGLLVCWWFLQSVVSAIGGFYNQYLLVVSPIGVVLGLVFVGDRWIFFPLFCWWFLPWWGVCDGGVVVVVALLGRVVVVVATLLGMCGCGCGYGCSYGCG